jgi:alkylhydroperoxidase family enzyme
MAAHSRHYREIMFGDTPLTRTEREAIAVVVSALNDCFY